MIKIPILVTRRHPHPHPHPHPIPNYPIIILKIMMIKIIMIKKHYFHYYLNLIIMKNDLYSLVVTLFLFLFLFNYLRRIINIW
jgi:hypothetical protein